MPELSGFFHCSIKVVRRMILKKQNGIRILVFLLGFCLCLYPLISGIVQSRKQLDLIQSHESTVAKTDDTTLDELLEQAQKYNSKLFQTQGIIIADNNNEELLDYAEQLSLNGSDIMARIEIPKISVDLPIYHGSSDEVLEVGVGHLEGTSLPVGGKSTHAILTGHRGLASSKMFTRLDELVEGDYFFVEVLNEKLAYQVSEIQVVVPDNTDILEIEEGKDKVSLITCTPYGINTHRLVITGERVEYSEKVYDSIEKGIPSVRELFFAAVPFIFISACLIRWALAKTKRKKEKQMKEYLGNFTSDHSSNKDEKGGLHGTIQNKTK
jgi:sortase A